MSRVRKTALIQLRCTAEEKELLEGGAQRRGMTLSRFLVHAGRSVTANDLETARRRRSRVALDPEERVALAPPATRSRLGLQALLPRAHAPTCKCGVCRGGQ